MRITLLRPGSLIFLVASLLCLGAGNKVAAEGHSSFVGMPLEQLMRIDVFRAATLTPTQQHKAPGTVYSFNQSDFVRLGIRRLEDILQFVPGIQVNQYRKRHKTIWSRGLLDRYNDKLVLLVDGIRRQHLYYGHFSLGDNLPLNKIEKVEIIQGPASSLYGANAFGGIISITTTGFSETPEVNMTFDLADNNRAGGTVQYNSPRLQVFGRYLGQDAAFRSDRLSFIGGQVLQPLDETYRNLFIKAKPFNGLTLSADFYENNTPFLFIPNTQDAFIEERKATLAALYESGEIDTGRVEANIFYTHDNTRELEYEQTTQAIGYIENQKSATAGASFAWFKRLHAEHVFTMGGTWQQEHARDMDYIRYFHFRRGFLTPPDSGNLLSNPDIKNNDYSLFAQDIWDINTNLTLTLGARYDSFEQFGKDLNYRAALVYTPDDSQTWKVLYGTAIRTPSFREYLKVLQGTTFIAPVPNPERIRSFELGYMRRWKESSINVNYFNNVFDDYIHEVPTPNNADEYFANSSQSWRMSGVELLLTHRFSEKLNLRLTSAYLNTNAGSMGSLPYLADWNASLGLDYKILPRHRLGLSLIYNSARDDTNTFTTDNPGNFILTNLFASGEVNKQISYRFGIDNLFDKKIYDPAGDFGTQHNTEKAERELWLQISWNPDL